MDDVSTVEATFDHLAQDDPLWAVLSDPSRAGGRWTWAEFLATGRADVDEVFQRLTELGALPQEGRALDFGCGVGRLSQALSGRFASVDAVDVSGRMIELARTAAEGPPGLRFHHNSRPDLGGFADASYDLVLSLLVVQHIPPALSRAYLKEFARLLKPGGVAVFDAPSHTRPSLDPMALYRWAAPAPLQRRLRQLRWGRHGMSQIYLLPRREVLAILEASGLEVVTADRRDVVARGTACYRYVAKRTSGPQPAAVRAIRRSRVSTIGALGHGSRTVRAAALT